MMINKIFVYWFNNEKKNYNNRTLIAQIENNFSSKNKFILLYNEKGKPFLKNHPNLYISITHTNFDTFFAISKKNIGIDVEFFDKKIDFFDKLIIDNYYSIKEQKYLKAQNSHEVFYYLWTRKEALIKLTSDNLNEKILKTTVIPDKIIFDKKQIIFKTITIEKNLIFSAAMYKTFLNNKVEIILQKL